LQKKKIFKGLPSMSGNIGVIGEESDKSKEKKENLRTDYASYVFYGR